MYCSNNFKTGIELAQELNLVDKTMSSPDKASIKKLFTDYGMNGEKQLFERIKQFIEKYPDNIRYERLENDPGIYAVWNKAIEMSTGEYITNINCDDRRKPDGLEQQAAILMSNKDCDLVYNDSYIVQTPNVSWEDIDPTATQRYNFEQFSKEAMLRGNLPHNNPMWRRSMHNKNGLFDEVLKSCADSDMWMRSVLNGSKFKMIPEILGLYYFNPEGMSTGKKNAKERMEEEKLKDLKYINLKNEQKNIS
jgi:glycosyltransferase involved in cell wall biosynthesis